LQLDKGIKKILKITGIFILSVLAIPLLVFLLLQTNRVQNYATQKIASILGSKAGTEISVGYVSIDFLNRVVLKDVLIKDWRKDTLIYSKKTVVGISDISYKKKYIALSKVEFEKAYVHLYSDSLKNMNITYIIDNLTDTADTASSRWIIMFKQVGLKNSAFRLDDYYKTKQDTGVNFSDMFLDSLNIRIKNMMISNGKLYCNINKLCFQEQSGFRLKSLTGKMTIKSSCLHFDNLKIETDRSNIEAYMLYFDFAKFGDFKYIENKVDIDAKIKKSSCSMADISMFATSLYGMNSIFEVSGKIEGKISNFQCKKFYFKIGKNTFFKGNTNIKGLPDIEKTYMNIDVDNMNVDIDDIVSIKLPDNQKIETPDIVKQLKIVGFIGNFDGYINNFKTSGDFKTPYGHLKADIQLNPEKKRKLTFVGSVSSDNFEPGLLFMKDSIVGKTQFSVNAKGFLAESNKIFAQIDWNIKSVILKNIEFRDIIGNGTLDNKTFDGTVKVDDERLAFEVKGNFNFSDTNPQFKFEANLEHANLLALNIMPQDSITNISFNVTANFKGNSINKFDGEIRLKEVNFEKKDKKLNINKIEVYTTDNQFSNDLQFRSDFLDATIFGRYDIADIPGAIIRTIRAFLPGSFYGYQSDEPLDDNEFMFNLKFKKTDSISKFFMPSVRISENSKISGLFFPADTSMRIMVQAQYLKIGNIVFDTIFVKAASRPDSLVLQVQTANLWFGPKIKMNKFYFDNSSKNDSSHILFFWKDSLKHKNKIKAEAWFTYTGPTQKPIWHFSSLPSNFYLLNENWQIGSLSLLFDSTGISFDKFAMYNGDKKIEITGKVSSSASDTLNAKFSDIDLTMLNFFMSGSNIFLNGKAKGQIAFTHPNNKAHINANININDFSLNHQIIGNTHAKLWWDPFAEKFYFTALASKENVPTLNTSGFITPATSEFNIETQLHSLSTKIFQPFVENLFHFHNGNINGQLYVKGKTDNPQISGICNVDSGDFTFIPFNTRYTFNSTIQFQNNNIIIAKTKVYDQKQQSFDFSGRVLSITRQPRFDLKLELKNNMVFNTSIPQAMPIYGTCYADGNVSITGTTDNLKIDITQAKTKEKTIVAIPLGLTDLSQSSFLRFKTIQKEEEHNVQKDLFEAKDEKKIRQKPLQLNIDLDATSDAELQLVFDPKVGDILYCRGNGNLKLEIDEAGNFKIRGDYNITEGEYLFTLRNLISKKFILQDGASITFGGNPLDATLNMQAIYKTKASIYPLTLDESSGSNDKKRIPVDCRLFVKGKLQNPDIRFDFDLPSASVADKDKVKSVVNTDQEMSQQFLSLLVMSSFMTPSNSGRSQGNSMGVDMASSSIEMLSGQISDMLSNLSDKFDVGVAYRPGDKTYTTNEVEVALSTQLFDDRVTINSSVDISNQENNNQKASNIVGDVNVEFKLTDKIKLKAFNRANDDPLQQDDIYTRGIGIVYREDFSNFKELKNKLFFKNKKAEKTDTLAKP